MATYHWQLEPPPADSQLAADASLGFDDQVEAEDWLGSFHTDLSQAGVNEVTLFDGDQLVLGPMSLAKA
ncbi:MAG: hypothetical protein LBL92_07845 [Propionibacteriaceae bacterium]|jgi:hypothetical protein|nr:hypothetical protein [Propionibacteriaceae bacterium]